MAFRVVLFAYRKPGLSPQDFKQRYEDVHIPLVKDISGSLFPLSHTRRYISLSKTSSEESTEATYEPELISGEPSDMPYDAITEMRFDTREDFYNFATLLNEPANAAKIAADCAEFLDTTKSPTMVVLEDLCESTRD